MTSSNASVIRLFDMTDDSIAGPAREGYIRAFVGRAQAHENPAPELSLSLVRLIETLNACYSPTRFTVTKSRLSIHNGSHAGRYIPRRADSLRCLGQFPNRHD